MIDRRHQLQLFQGCPFGSIQCNRVGQGVEPILQRSVAATLPFVFKVGPSRESTHLDKTNGRISLVGAYAEAESVGPRQRN